MPLEAIHRHAKQCDWHCDQYDHECTCGATRPATVEWARAEVAGASHDVLEATRHLAVAEARLAKMLKAALGSP